MHYAQKIRQYSKMFKRWLIHATLITIRIIAVICAMHFAFNFLEMHGFFNKFGRTGEFAWGSLMDYLMFELGGKGEHTTQ